MMSSLYIATTGMISLGSGMQTISNNLANTNTIGFKERLTLYEDLAYTGVQAPSNFVTNMSQLGHGSKVEANISRFYENGAFTPGNSVTDIGIFGSGFFQVTNADKVFYTRAGNFRFTKEGVLVDPNYFTLMGHSITNGNISAELTPITLKPDANGYHTMPGKATTNLKLVNNLGINEATNIDIVDPFFSMVKSWNADKNPPTQAGYTDAIQIYDSDGNPQMVNFYFDKVEVPTDGRNIFQYTVGINPNIDDRTNFKNTKGAGAVLTGTMTFSSDGIMESMTAFAPSSGSNISDLSTWKSVPINADGSIPVSNISFSVPAKGDQPAKTTTAQSINITFGLAKAPPGINSIDPTNIGNDAKKLPGYTTKIQREDRSNLKPSTSAYPGSSSNIQRTQDGYAFGYLSEMKINGQGIMTGYYTNGHSEDLYKIPLFKFNGEQELKAEGKNHFSTTTGSGEAIEGTAGEGPYGGIISNSLESSNVDMARQFAHMIITQRGFQMNSKIITTSDAMLQKALEIKRQ